MPHGRTSHLARHAPSLPLRLYRLDLAAGAAGLALVAVSLVGMSGASAANPVSDGSDWGPQGALVSNSPQTAAWDNTGNSPTSTVPRDATQLLPHTVNKSYADIASADRSAYNSYFGPGNGLGGLEVSVSQTENLVNQSVSVSISGAKANIAAGTTDSASYFQIFQCWGAMGSNGQPDPAATSPDPATCQVGALGSDAVGQGLRREFREVNGDPLVPGGDWAPYDKPLGIVDVPFLGVDGETSGSTYAQKNKFFNHTTTNEFSHVTVPISGSTTRQFEVQTGAEANGLGCGYRSDQASTASCWLVVVPRIAAFGNAPDVDGGLGPVSPSVWGERMQFRLGFQDVATSCASGTAQSLIGGSEMLANAAASWIPGICGARSVTLGYNKQSDQVARTQYAGGLTDAILTSDPVPGSSAADVVPLAVTAPVIAFSLDYQPVCTGGVLAIANVTTDAQAITCGYASLAALRTDLAKAGQPVQDLRLDARLVAKLLTMSYRQSLIAVFGVQTPAWAGRLPVTLTADPEFQALNPQLHLDPSGAGNDTSSLIVEAARSDAATTVWRWLEADPDAASFLSGCPDAHGVTVNPFYSTRTYTGCPAQAAALAAQADADRQATVKPAGFVDQVQSYPPDGAPYPLPQWQELPAQTASDGTVTQNPLTLVDWQPRVSDMSTAARDVFIGYRPRNDEFCTTASGDPSCTPAPGKWRDRKIYKPYGQRQWFSITDTASAARYQLSTASLCDDSGADCVGADAGSLEAAAGDFADSGVAGFKKPAPAPDYAGGAYPLTLPVYAVVRSSLPASQRSAYAEAFSYITGQGQVPGYEPGDLPPGYAPLPTAFTAQVSSGIAALRTADPVRPATASSRPSSSTTAKPTRKPSSSASTSTSASATASPSASAIPGTSAGPGGSAGPGLSAAPSGGPPSGSGLTSAVPASASADANVQTTPVAASTESWPSWVLPLGLGLALGAGMAGPFLRRRTNVTLR